MFLGGFEMYSWHQDGFNNYSDIKLCLSRKTKRELDAVDRNRG